MHCKRRMEGYSPSRGSNRVEWMVGCGRKGRTSDKNTTQSRNENRKQTHGSPTDLDLITIKAMDSLRPEMYVAIEGYSHLSFCVIGDVACTCRMFPVPTGPTWERN